MNQEASFSDPSETVSHKDKKLSKKFPTEMPNEVVEEQTKKVPNLIFLALALGSIAGSAFLTFAKSKTHLGNFVGLWAPTFLLLGVYNKLVKIEDELMEIHESTSIRKVA